jgi:hypothetical protein
MVALQILAIPIGIAAVCALPSERIHRFHFVSIFLTRDTSSQSVELSAFDSDPVACAQVVNPVEVEHPELATVHAHVNAKDLVVGFVVLFDAVSCHRTADDADASGQYAATATTNLAPNDSTQHGAEYGPTARGAALDCHGFNAAHPAHFSTLRVATGGTRCVSDRISTPRVEGTTQQQTQGCDGQRQSRSSDFHNGFLKSGSNAKAIGRLMVLRHIRPINNKTTTMSSTSPIPPLGA